MLSMARRPQDTSVGYYGECLTVRLPAFHSEQHLRSLSLAFTLAGSGKIVGNICTVGFRTAALLFPCFPFTVTDSSAPDELLLI